MSPPSVRRYRAERLLREEFEVLKSTVLATVAGKLAARAGSLGRDDLEACYAIAWQGLYAAVLDGEEIANPVGWLVLVTYRRALEECRAPARRLHEELEHEHEPSREHDIAAELDDREQLRRLFEGLRGRLGAREREAAVLCYLHGLSRAEAAARMGVSETRMRKLMDGRGSGEDGVAGKVGVLVRAIREGSWCEEQASSMRAFAFGVLDPAGERYAVALAHRRECPACRAYVSSLRGLAAVLPPVLAPWAVGAGALGGVGARGALAAGGSAGSAHGAATGAGAGALGASAAAGGGASGAGWLAAGGPLAAKLAVACLFAAGVGAGCAALDLGSHGTAGHHARAPVRSSIRARASAASSASLPSARPLAPSAATVTPRRVTDRSLASAAEREFGPEHGAARSSASAGPTAGALAAHAAAARVASPSSDASSAVGARSSATREFAPG